MKSRPSRAYKYGPMKWPQKLIEGKFLKRYKRFFADVELAGKIEVAHVPNTGSLKSVISSAGSPVQECLVSPAKDPNRKLKFTLEAIKSDSGHWVGVNTSWPNTLAKEAFEKGTFPHWKKFSKLNSEVKINAESRLDLMLETDTGDRHYVEIKNVTMRSGEVAQFPDAVTERGQKHLIELMNLVKKGHSAEILFAVQRDDVKSFSAAHEIDPEYAKLLKQAKEAGVKISVYPIVISPEEIFYSQHALEVRL